MLSNSISILVYAVFHTPSAFHISVVCAYRMSQINLNFDHGRFKVIFQRMGNLIKTFLQVQRTPSSSWTPFQQPFSSSNFTERPGKCQNKQSPQNDIGTMIIKNPLMYDLVQQVGQRPILIEGPGKPKITSIAVLSPARSVRNQNYDVE